MIVEVKRSELPVEKGWFDYISFCFFIGTLALWKLWTWSSKTLKETVKSAENCMIYLLVLHDQMINAKFLISRLFDESPSVALWSFQFFNTYKLPGTWWFWLPLVCLISFVPHHQSDRLMFILTLLHFSYWLAHVLFDGRLACSGIFDSTVSDDVIRMMSHVAGFSKPYGCSSNNHNWITQPGKGQESYLF